MFVTNVTRGTDSMPARSRRRWYAGLCATLTAVAALAALPALAQAAAPANHDLAGAQVVHVGDRATGTLVNATLQAGEPATSSEPVDHTIWFRLTPATTERLRLDTCGANPYSEVAVFTGSDVTTLTEVARGEYGCTSGGRVYIDAVAGTTYDVRVAGYDFGDAIALTVARPQVPANDDFANAQSVGVPATVSGTNVDATVQPGEVDPVALGSDHSVWYRFTPTTADAVLLSLADCGNAAGNASTLTVYTGDSVGSVSEVGDFAPACGFRNMVAMFPKARTTYRIAVRGGAHTADAFTLRVALVPSAPGSDLVPPPPNPDCPFQLAAPGSVTYDAAAGDLRRDSAAAARPRGDGAASAALGAPHGERSLPGRGVRRGRGGHGRRRARSVRGAGPATERRRDAHAAPIRGGPAGGRAGVARGTQRPAAGQGGRA
jgi:hypothetical protein